MPLRIYIALLAGTLFAAVGQLFFKLGANGREDVASFLNVWIFAGLASYGLGTILWIYSLSKANLNLVFPFTALTFVLVYLLSVFILHEPTSPQSILGVLLVLGGLFLISSA